MLGGFIAGWICGEHFNWRQACGAVLAQRASLSLNSFFFSCVGTKAPPSAKMPWGYLSRKKDTVFCKKVVKVKI